MHMGAMEMGLEIGVHWRTSDRALAQATAKITPLLQTAK